MLQHQSIREVQAEGQSSHFRLSRNIQLY